MSDPRLSIGLVTGHYPPGPASGSGQIVRALARGLHALGHDVRVLAGCGGEPSEREVLRGRVDGVPVAYLPRTEAEAGDLCCARIEARAAEWLGGCDLVHLHEWRTLSFGLARRLEREVKVVATLHDSLLACGLRGREIDAEVAACEGIFLPSATHLAHLATCGDVPVEKVTVLDHGLCTELAPARRGRAYWSGARPLSVLHFGGRTEAKGTLDLVRILARLPEGSCELILAGEERERGLDERLKEAAGELRLRVFGPYGPGELADLASICDLAAFPWRTDEADSLVVDEALALGLPVWISERGAGVEVLDRRAPGRRSPGRLLPAEDLDAWEAAFLELFAEPERLARYRQALPREIRRSDEAASELADHYQRLLREHQPARSD